MSLFVQLITYVLIGYILIVIFMYFWQENLLFFPTSQRHEVSEFENVIEYSLQRDSVILNGWLVNPSRVRDKLLIYYGGNAEDIFLNIDEYQDIRASSLFVSYRGFGPSGGKPGEKALYSDALAVIDDVIKRYAPGQIYLIGRSLGSGVACYAAAHRSVQGIILVTPYDSIENVARQAYPWLPVGLLLRHKFMAAQYLEKVQCPVLVIYGGSDSVVRPERTNNLIKKISTESEIVFIERAEHGTIELFAEYWEAILTFINRAD